LEGWLVDLGLDFRMRCKSTSTLLQFDNILRPGEFLIAFRTPRAFVAKIHYALFAHHMSAPPENCYLLVHKRLLAGPATVLLQLILI
jgi:hypothetical protein